MIKNPKNIPTTSGVYFFKNPKGKILYIGKAANLKNRLVFYLKKNITNTRIASMLQQAVKLAWQETDSEVEALILESRSIKKHRPPFNILMRDDKQYFYVVFTKEKFPKIFLTHQPLTLPHKTLIGPFTDGTALKTTLKLLRKTFPYCTCKEKHNNYCLNYHLDNCPGFCCLKVDQSQTKDKKSYQKNIRSIKDILSGKRMSLSKKMEKEMQQAAKENDFIKAIAIRNKLRELKWIFENAKIIKQLEEKDKTLKEVQNFFGLPVLPRRIEAFDISNIQGQFAVGAMAVFTDGQPYMAESPGFRPDKSQYRKFKIKHTRSGGDIAMLKEILSRRLKHREWPLPDLIIIDGGKAQLNAAHSAISNLKSKDEEIKILALTKNNKHQADHIFVAGNPKPLRLNFLTPDVRKLILEANSEAHRFAIDYYRKVHRKSYIDSNDKV